MDQAAIDPASLPPTADYDRYPIDQRLVEASSQGAKVRVRWSDGSLSRSTKQPWSKRRERAG